jgi:hypothetical protein
MTLSKDEKMELTDHERLARQRKWESTRQKLQERLGALGLVVERDYAEKWWPIIKEFGIKAE